MTTTKVDFKRELRSLYTASKTPALVEVPELQYLMVDGHGDPNGSQGFRDAVGALYALSYGARFVLKRTAALDYRVMPLEGLWSAPEMPPFPSENTLAWDWTLMIMQPEQVTPEVVAQAMRDAAHKKLPALDRVRLERLAEGRAAQIMHHGAYSNEGPTIAALHAFIADCGLEPVGRHHEIYLSDPRRAAPESMRTILRQPVRS
jgi:hypothetical protein